MSQSYLVYDIETAPNEAALAEPYPQDERLPPGNYKNPDVIAKWRAEDKEGWEQARIKEFSLSPRMGRVVAYSVHANVGEPTSEVGIALDESGEKELLAKLLSHLGNSRYDVVVGFNNKAFDWPFIAIRALVNGLNPRSFFGVPSDLGDMAYRYSKRHQDLRHILNFGNVQQNGGSLDKWCRAFGIPAKTSAGSDIYTWVKQRNHKAIEAHARGDTQRTAELWERVQGIL